MLPARLPKPEYLVCELQNKRHKLDMNSEAGVRERYTKAAVPGCVIESASLIKPSLGEHLVTFATRHSWLLKIGMARQVRRLSSQIRSADRGLVEMSPMTVT